MKRAAADRALAKRIARELFTDGFGRRWPSLMHFTDGRQATGTGWCEAAVAETIMVILNKPRRSRRAKEVKRG